MDKNQKDKKAAKREDKSKEKNAKTKEDKKPKKEKKTEDKKSADKEKVKRPCGAYILFGKDERPKIMKEHPDIKNTEIMRLIGEAWGKLPDDQKKKYQDLADKDKERYEKECKEKGIDIKGKKKKGIKSEKPKKPKKVEDSASEPSDSD